MEIALGGQSPRLEIDGKPVETCTRVVAAAGYVLTLDTVLPRHGIELHSTYTGHPQAEQTLVTELFLSRSREPLLDTREADAGELPVLHDRQRCLYDHLLRLHELLSELRVGAVTIDGLDEAVERLSP
jgi:hypothetical protein